MEIRKNKVTLDKRGALLAASSILLTAAYQSLWYLAPQLLAHSLWAGSALNVGFLLGTLSICVPIFIAWLIVRSDRQSPSRETFEVSDH